MNIKLRIVGIWVLVCVFFIIIKQIVGEINKSGDSNQLFRILSWVLSIMIVWGLSYGFWRDNGFIRVALIGLQVRVYVEYFEKSDIFS